MSSYPSSCTSNPQAELLKDKGNAAFNSVRTTSRANADVLTVDQLSVWLSCDIQVLGKNGLNLIVLVAMAGRLARGCIVLYKGIASSS